MKRLVLAGAAVAGTVLVAGRLARTCGRVDFGEWIAAMPDNAPPKWMYTNVTAIRGNTERILELLERQERGGA